MKSSNFAFPCSQRLRGHTTTPCQRSQQLRLHTNFAKPFSLFIGCPWSKKSRDTVPLRVFLSAMRLFSNFWGRIFLRTWSLKNQPQANCSCASWRTVQYYFLYLQKLHQRGLHSLPAPCCSPREYQALEVLYFEDLHDGTVEVKVGTLDNIMATSCGCG